jgi:hypothetical protein
MEKSFEINIIHKITMIRNKIDIVPKTNMFKKYIHHGYACVIVIWFIIWRTVSVKISSRELNIFYGQPFSLKFK